MQFDKEKFNTRNTRLNVSEEKVLPKTVSEVESDIKDTSKTDSLESRMKQLEEAFKNHQHTSLDGSKGLTADIDIQAKSYTAVGGAVDSSGAVAVPFAISNGKLEQDKAQRQVGFGFANSGDKDSATESIQALIAAEKYIDITKVPNESNKWDFTSIYEAQIVLDYQPGRTQSFLYGYSTPAVASDTGTIELGGSTLTDINAKFTINQLVGSVLYISDTLEAHKITANTKNIIQIDSTWASASGTHSYFLYNAMYLGANIYPYKRIYAGDDIRLGYGDSSGSQVLYIKWGSGSPEAVVIANVGSLYLRTDGGASTTLYVKTSGTGNTGWTAK